MDVVMGSIYCLTTVGSINILFWREDVYTKKKFRKQGEYEKLETINI